MRKGETKISIVLWGNTRIIRNTTMKRSIKTFEPTPDVLRMLERAEKDGIKLKHILNNAARQWLHDKGYARKKDICAAGV